MHASACCRARRASGDTGAGSAGTPGHPGTPRVGRAVASLLPGLRAFFRTRHGGGAIESALSLAALATVFAGLMAIAHAAYEDDRMGRAARAAARAVALTDTAATQTQLASAACEGIKNELGLDDDFDCKTWTEIKVVAGLAHSSLSNGTSTGGETGDMILVTIDWKQAPWVQAVRKLDGSDGRIATGVARREPADPAAGA